MTTRTFSTANPRESPVFTHLRNGSKTVEGRPYSKKQPELEQRMRQLLASHSSHATQIFDLSNVNLCKILSDNFGWLVG